MGIVLITGTPGVGKTTVAVEVAKALGLKYVNVGELARKEGLVLGYDEVRRAYIIDIAGVAACLREIAKRERIIVDTHVVEAIPPEVLELAVVLRLDPRVLLERLRQRNYPPLKIKENIESEILDQCLQEAVARFGAERVFEVDTTSKTPREVVSEVVKIVQARKGAPPGSVSWVERLGDRLAELLSSLGA